MTATTRTLILAVAAIAAVFFAVLFPAIIQFSVPVSILFGLGAILSAIHTVSKRLWALQGEVSKINNTTTLSVASELHSMHVLQNRFPQCSIPTTGWSMRFANLHAIVDVMDQLSPSTIVEFGSGISTLCVGAWLKEQGRGRIISFDHDGGWAQVTRRHLSAQNLDKYAEVIVVPLSRHQAETDSHDWYEIIPHIGSLVDIDLVIVDGPPAGSVANRLSRHPALPALYDRLAAGAVIVLDDASRPGELEVIQKWVAEFPAFKLRIRESVTGLAILERSAQEGNNADQLLVSRHNTSDPLIAK